MKRVVLATAVIIAWSSGAAAQAPAATGQPVELKGTHHLTLTSKVLAREFQISVSLPWTYDASRKRYPVLYMTDADSGFGLGHAAYAAAQLDAEIPETILVGIGYGVDFTKGGFSTWSQRRAGELTPTAVKDRPGSGEGPLFARFLREELIPFVDARYRTQPDDRTLVGGSLGGLFAVYTLLQHPGVFQQFVVRSPSLWWDDRAMFALERDYAARHRDLAVTIYTSMGTLETTLMRSTWQDFFQTLQGRQYKSLRVIVANMNDAKHATAIGMSLYPGLKAVLGGMPLDTTTIDRYIGRFKFPQGDTLSITREGQTLVAAWNGEEGLKLAARTPTRFSFTTGQVQLVAGTPKLLPLIGLEYLDVTITAQGTVDTVVLHREGQSFTGTRESPER